MRQFYHIWRKKSKSPNAKSPNGCFIHVLTLLTYASNLFDLNLESKKKLAAMQDSTISTRVLRHRNLTESKQTVFWKHYNQIKHKIRKIKESNLIEELAGNSQNKQIGFPEGFKSIKL